MDGIVLKDRNGNNIEYPGVNHIKVKTTDGATKDFIARTPVETTVDLDFSGGAMEVNPESEELFSKVNIPVPANLIPENIAEGVDIAGIVGALAAGGKDVKMSAGKFTTTGVVTVEHGLGVTPDMIWAFGLNTLATDSGLRSIFGTTFEVREQCGLESWFVQHGCYYMKGVLGVYIKNASITKVDSANPLNSANETSFIIGTANYPCNMEMYWLAIGGLT